MKKQDIYEFLKQKNIEHEITEHKAVFSMNDISDIPIPHPEADAKNLFVRDDKKRNYYLITVRGNKRVDLKGFRKEHNTRPLSFASEEELKNILDLTPGSVSPFGILNDKEHIVNVFLDSDFSKDFGLIGIHPNDNTATVWLKFTDLLNILKEYGNNVDIIDIN